MKRVLIHLINKMNLTIKCEKCNQIYEAKIESVFDVTPCNCGSCHGEKFKVYFTYCPNCGLQPVVEVNE